MWLRQELPVQRTRMSGLSFCIALSAALRLFKGRQWFEEKGLRLLWRRAFVQGKTSGVTLRELEQQLRAIEFHRFKRELADELHLVFDIDFHIVGREERTGLVQNAEKFPSREAMFVVVGGPGLQATHEIVAKRAAAIDEPLFDTCHFGYVRVGRDAFAVWQNEAQRCFGMPREGGFEFV